MSTQWWTHTSTRQTKEEVRAFLATLPGARESSDFPAQRDETVENPRQFETPSLRSLLPVSFATADPPEDNLQKVGWATDA